MSGDRIGAPCSFYAQRVIACDLQQRTYFSMVHTVGTCAAVTLKSRWKKETEDLLELMHIFMTFKNNMLIIYFIYCSQYQNGPKIATNKKRTLWGWSVRLCLLKVWLNPTGHKWSPVLVFFQEVAVFQDVQWAVSKWYAKHHSHAHRQESCTCCWGYQMLISCSMCKLTFV